jgi:hypothetical protein
MKRLIFIATAISVTFLFSCREVPKQGNDKALTEYSARPTAKTPTANGDSSVIWALSKQVLTSLKSKDYKTFAGFIHPTEGVRFSPYTFVDTARDLVFKAAAFEQKMAQKKKINWGPYSAGEEDIEMTGAEYFATFVYNADFLNAERQALNDFIGGGTTTNNIKEIYPNCPFTEGYFSGFEKKFDGMDWCSLRLVFKKYLDKYYLIGVVHDNWTT